MEKHQREVPYFAARLIMGFTHNRLSEAEKDRLDKWVGESDENMAIFEDLILGMEDEVFDPWQFIEETDSVTELWVLAGLITKRRLNVCDESEEKHLAEWADACERNRSLYEKMLQPGFVEQLASWVKNTGMKILIRIDQFE